MNKIILKGRLTANPEVKQTSNGVAVVKFTIAVNRRFDREKADFIQCEAWKQTAELIGKHFSKGKEIAVVGELHIDKSDANGKTNYFTKVVVDEVYFCGSKADDAPATPYTATAGNMTNVPDGDDLPF